MKTIVIYLIRAYQVIPFIGHKMCRFTPTCSEYMIEAIERFGLKKGIKLGINRLKRCRPYGDIGFDPVPNEENE